MAAYRAGKPSWVDPGFYPVSEQLAEKFDPSSSEVMLVDVGGGLGHDLRELREKHPSLPGRLVLQDRAEVIDTVTNGGEIFEATVHDFFTAQPVMGARTYYLHSVLHDWGDDDCVKILEQLKPAMKPGYSSLLINEIIMPIQDPRHGPSRRWTSWCSSLVPCRSGPKRTGMGFLREPASRSKRYTAT